MRDLCRLIEWMVVDLIRSRAALEAEIWTLRQQIDILRRTAPQIRLQRYRPIDIRWSLSIVFLKFAMRWAVTFGDYLDRNAIAALVLIIVLIARPSGLGRKGVAA